MAGNGRFTGLGVIASSNRHNDLIPYCSMLFKSDPAVWEHVVPWDFPQHADRETEEAFLRQYFSEREIYMQGGAVGFDSGPGNGFRFLKQVWYSTAIWNVKHRAPKIAQWWFQKESTQQLLSDPSMVDWMHSKDAQAATFFDAKEIDQYGEKILSCAVKIIQCNLRAWLAEQVSRDQQEQQDQTAAMNGASIDQSAQDEQSSSDEIAPLAEPAIVQLPRIQRKDSAAQNSSDEPVSAVSAFPILEGSEFHTPKHTAVASATPPTHKSEEYQQDPVVVSSRPPIREPLAIFPDFAGPTQEVTEQQRTAPDKRDGSQHMERREHIPPARGDWGSRGRYKSYGKGRSHHDQSNHPYFHDRNNHPRSSPNFVPFQMAYDPTAQQNRTSSAINRNAMSPPFIMQRLQGQPMGNPREMQQQQYVDQFSHLGQNKAPPPSFTPHQATHYWNGNSLEDHANHSNQRRDQRASSDNYSGSGRDPTFHNRHGGPTRDYQTHHVTKRGSYGTGRNKRGRGSDSFTSGPDVFQNQVFQPPPQNPAAPSSGVVYMPTAHQNQGSNQKTWSLNQMPQQSQNNENSTPWHSGFDHNMQMGPNQSQWGQMPQSDSMSGSAPPPNMSIPRTLDDPHADDKPNIAKKSDPPSRYQIQPPRTTTATTEKNDPGVLFPKEKLNQYHISPECTHVNSLAVFQSAEAMRMTEAEMRAHFAPFGRVTYVDYAYPLEGDPWFVNFATHWGAIRALQQLGGESPRGLRVEVPRKFWDRGNKNFPAMRLHQVNQESQDQGLSTHQRDGSVASSNHTERPDFSLTETLTRGRLSESSTPTASSHTSPDKRGPKTKSKKSKKKPHGPRHDVQDSKPELQQHPLSVEHASENKSKDSTGNAEGKKSVGDVKVHQADQTMSKKNGTEADTKLEQKTTSHKQPHVKLPQEVSMPSKTANVDKAPVNVQTSQTDGDLPSTSQRSSQVSEQKTSGYSKSTSPTKSGETEVVPFANGHQLQQREDGHVDESFHTATGSPLSNLDNQSKVDKTGVQIFEDTSITTGEEPNTPRSTPSSKQKTSHVSSATPDVADPAKTAPLLTLDTALTTDVQSEDNLTSELASPLAEPKSAKKVALPLSLGRASKDSAASPKSSAQKPSEYFRTVRQITVRSNSGSTVIASPFVTAPNTPNEARTDGPPKKAEKAKGPAHTESLSMFSKRTKQKKKEKPKKGIGGSLRGDKSLAESLAESPPSLVESRKENTVVSSLIEPTDTAKADTSSASVHQAAVLPAAPSTGDAVTVSVKQELIGQGKRDSAVEGTKSPKHVSDSKSDTNSQERANSPKSKGHWTNVFGGVRDLISSTPRKLTSLSPHPTAEYTTAPTPRDKKDSLETSDIQASKLVDDVSVSKNEDPSEDSVKHLPVDTPPRHEQDEETLSRQNHVTSALAIADSADETNGTQKDVGLGISTSVDVPSSNTTGKGKKKKKKSSKKAAVAKTEDQEQRSSLDVLAGVALLEQGNPLGILAAAAGLQEKIEPTASNSRITDVDEEPEQSSTTESFAASPALRSRRAAAVAASQQGKHLVTATPRMGRVRRRGVGSSSKQPDSPPESPESPDEPTTTIILPGIGDATRFTGYEELQRFKGKFHEPDWQVERTDSSHHLNRDREEMRVFLGGMTATDELVTSESVNTGGVQEEAEARELYNLLGSDNSTESDHTATPDESSYENEGDRP